MVEPQSRILDKIVNFSEKIFLEQQSRIFLIIFNLKEKRVTLIFFNRRLKKYFFDLNQEIIKKLCFVFLNI